jgi:hypothetical protein
VYLTGIKSAVDLPCGWRKLSLAAASPALAGLQPGPYRCAYNQFLRLAGDARRRLVDKVKVAAESEIHYPAPAVVANLVCGRILDAM